MDHTRRQAIIAEYGKLLREHSTTSISEDDSRLPKYLVRHTLLEELRQTENPVTSQHLETLLTRLAMVRPAQEHFVYEKYDNLTEQVRWANSHYPDIAAREQEELSRFRTERLAPILEKVEAEQIELQRAIAAVKNGSLADSELAASFDQGLIKHSMAHMKSFLTPCWWAGIIFGLAWVVDLLGQTIGIKAISTSAKVVGGFSLLPLSFFGWTLIWQIVKWASEYQVGRRLSQLRRGILAGMYVLTFAILAWPGVDVHWMLGRAQKDFVGFLLVMAFFAFFGRMMAEVCLTLPRPRTYLALFLGIVVVFVLAHLGAFQNFDDYDAWGSVGDDESYDATWRERMILNIVFNSIAGFAGAYSRFRSADRGKLCP